MRVGIVAEGRGDLAVLVNILRGKLGLDLEDIQFLRPEYTQDQTDLHDQAEEERGGWGRVKRECVERATIREFVENALDEEVLVVVQVDTAEAHLTGFDVARPERKASAYTGQLRERVVERIHGWLEGELVDRVRYAVAVEETDAWVLTIHTTKDASSHHDPKAALEKALNKALPDKERKRLFQLKAYKRYAELTKPFRKLRDLEECATRNLSLRLFVDSLTVTEPSRSSP